MADCAGTSTVSITSTESIRDRGSENPSILILLAETLLVATATILAVWLSRNYSSSHLGWLLVPFILTLAAFLPAVLRRTVTDLIGPNYRSARAALLLVLRTSAVLAPGVLVVCYLVRLSGRALPLAWPVPLRGGWASWLLYQFMYVAVAEELFFRGYLQTNILKALAVAPGPQFTTRHWIGIVISAALFALAHVVVQGQIISVLTFLPGLVLGWLFLRSGSLLAPILFHGFANTFYCLVAALIA